MEAVGTFVKPVHVELTYKRRDVGVLKILTKGARVSKFVRPKAVCRGVAYDNTFEKSAEGDMTKLSADDDHEMRCCILVSSSMLLAPSVAVAWSGGTRRVDERGGRGFRILTCIVCG